LQRYSTLALPDVYAVLAYYLRHPILRNHEDRH
jgi:hypothetical protein